MKSKNLYLFIFALLINCSQLKALTLSEAVTLALDSYPGLQANYQDVNAASARIDFAYSGYKPDIFIDARPQVVVRRHSSKSYPASASINFIQPLYRGGRTTAAILGATYEYHSQDFLYEEDVQRLILEIASLYVEILKEQAVLK